MRMTKLIVRHYRKIGFLDFTTDPSSVAELLRRVDGHPPSLRYGAASWRIPGRKRRCPNFFCRFPHDAVKSLQRKSCWQLVRHKRKVLPSNLL